MKTWIAASAALVAAACTATTGTQTSADAPPIVGAWRIEDVDNTGFIDFSRLDITFSKDGGVSGHSGCNSFAGSYARNGDAIEIGPLVATEMACAPALMHQEARLLATLGAVDAIGWSEEDGALMLTGPAPASLTLRVLDAPDGEATTPHGAVIAPVVSGQAAFVE